MKNIMLLTAALLTLFTSASATQNSVFPLEAPTFKICPSGGKVLLPAGTLVILETAEDIFSTATRGTNVVFRVRTDVYAEGEVVIRTGAQAFGRVKRVEPATNNSPASITIELFYVQAVDMQQVPLYGNEQTLVGQDPNTNSTAPVMSNFTAQVMNNIKIDPKVD